MNIEYGALNKHSIETGHKFNFENVKIIQNEKNKFKRLILETLRINLENEYCNYKINFNQITSKCHKKFKHFIKNIKLSRECFPLTSLVTKSSFYTDDSSIM